MDKVQVQISGRTYKGIFKKDIDLRNAVNIDEILKKAGADMWLSNGTVFCSYPRSVYRSCAIDTWDYIKDGIDSGNVGGHYDKKFDSWTADMIGSVTGWTRFRRRKCSYERPGVYLNLEVYDIHIANRKLKKKERLIEVDRKKLPPRDNPAVHMFKIKVG